MKKLKLLMSVSLLCLSLAILCVGVFSAVNVSYDIAGTIHYEIEDVFCKIRTKVYKREDQRTSVQLQEDVNTLSATEFDNITYTLSQDMGTYDSSLNQGSSSVTGINLNFGKESSSGKYYYTYYIVINVENLSNATNMYAELEDTNNETNVNKICRYIQTAILKSDNTRNIVIAYSVNDLLSEISNMAFNYTLNVKLGDYYSKYSDISLWTGYSYGERFAKTYNSTTKLSTVTVSTNSGWEVLGFKMEVEKNKDYNITVDFEMPTYGYYTGGGGGEGLALMALTGQPDNTHCLNLNLQYINFKSNEKGTKTLTFNSGDNSIIYIALNHGYMEDGHSYTYKIGNFKFN